MAICAKPTNSKTQISTAFMVRRVGKALAD